MTALRYMDSLYESTCLYCGERAAEATQIAGHFGIRWGHKSCVEHHLENSTLIISPNNAARRPKALMERANRRVARKGGKAVAIQWSGSKDEGVVADINFQKKGIESVTAPRSCYDPLKKPKKASTRKKGLVVPPKSACVHHHPAMFIDLSIPKEMCPLPRMVDEEGLAPHTLKELLEKVWENLKRIKFSYYARNTLEAPICSAHGPLDIVEVNTMYWWNRTYWWVCPWKPEDDEKKRSYNGYELIG